MTENDILVPGKVKRYRRFEEKLQLQNQIAKLRTQGCAFSVIAERVALSEVQVRRHWRQFFVDKLKYLTKEKVLIYGQLLYQFEFSLELSNQLLCRAMDEGEISKIGGSLKFRQEALKDYRDFLDSTGLFKGLVTSIEQEDSDEPVAVLQRAYRDMLKEKMREAQKQDLEELKKKRALEKAQKNESKVESNQPL